MVEPLNFREFIIKLVGVQKFRNFTVVGYRSCHKKTTLRGWLSAMHTENTL